MFDGDDAGYYFTEKLATKLEALFQVKKCLLPVGLDPKNLEQEDTEFMINRLLRTRQTK
jgi:DNA primase